MLHLSTTILLLKETTTEEISMIEFPNQRRYLHKAKKMVRLNKLEIKVMSNLRILMHLKSKTVHKICEDCFSNFY